TREGEKRTSFEIDVDDVGPALRYATAKINRVQRGGGSGGFGGDSAGGGAPADDPWTTGGGGDNFDEPPF
ncbi:MAG: single-stranded DNA-binding protein, partial [Candidatus Nanopelagicales bacterium]